MSWNYRVVETEECGIKLYGLHEVYYDDDGKIKSWTQKPSIVCDTENFSDFMEKLRGATEKDTLHFNGAGQLE